MYQTRDGTEYHRNYAFTLAANTWTKVTFTTTGNSNLQIDSDTGRGLDLYIITYYGTDYTGGEEVSTTDWYSRNGQTDAYLPNFTQNWANTLNATFDITGVQLEVGSTATPFEHRSYGDELARCQRYFQKISGAASRAYTSDGYWGYGITSPVTMRSTPTTSNPTYTGDYSLPGTGPSFKANTVDHVSMQYNGSAATYWAYRAEVTRDSEL
jgi:hypothetical protein